MRRLGVPHDLLDVLHGRSVSEHQGAEGVDKLWVLAASAPLDVPDLTVYLDVPVAQRSERMSGRPSADRYEAAGLQARLHRSYQESITLLRTHGHYIAVVNGAGEPSLVAASVTAELDALP